MYKVGDRVRVTLKGSDVPEYYKGARGFVVEVIDPAASYRVRFDPAIKLPNDPIPVVEIECSADVMMAD